MKGKKKSSSSMDPSIWVIIIGGLMLLAAGFILFLQSRNNTPSTQATPLLNVPYPEVARISVADAKAAYDQNSVIFIDTRGDEFYNQGHIPGSLAITEEQLNSAIANLDPNAWIITYCT